MSYGWLPALANHLWQSTIVTVMASLLVLTLRKYGAHVRYWIWFGASLKFLVPFSILASFGSEIAWRPSAKATTPASAVFMATEIAQPFAVSTVAPSPVSAVGTIGFHLPTLLLTVWCAGFVAILLMWARSWLRIRAITRRATRRTIGEYDALILPALVEPSVFGIFRPVLLIPENIERRLSPEQLRSVLAHEMYHVRRGDNLLSSIHMIGAAIFWFYPVVWWLGARLLDERERACDELVLYQGNDPIVYAEGILKVCEAYVKSPLQCAPGVSGSKLQQRIRRIVKHAPIRPLGSRKAYLLAATALAVFAAPISSGIFNARPRSQNLGQNLPEFGAASIRPSNKTFSNTPRRACRGSDTVVDPKRAQTQVPLGRCIFDHAALDVLIVAAYSDDLSWIRNQPPRSVVLDGPAWVYSDLFDVEAIADKPANVSAAELHQMMRAVLADRFKLRLHRAPKETSGYALSLTNKGPKLSPAKDKTVSSRDRIQRMTSASGMITLSARNVPMTTLSELLTTFGMGPVVDKTAIEGTYDFTLTYSAESISAAGRKDGSSPTVQVQDSGAASIFTAVREQLGLQLISQKVSLEYLVIDSVDKASIN